MTCKVVFCGPPHSGKSCLVVGVRDASLRIGCRERFYALYATPDGEGSWFQETRRNFPETAETLRARLKRTGGFSPEFIALQRQWVELVPNNPTLIDLGGKPAPDNAEIAAGASHAVIVHRPDGGLEEWQRFCAEVGLRVIARALSILPEGADEVRRVDDDLLELTLHHLERGVPLAERPSVQALTRHIAEVAGVA